MSFILPLLFIIGSAGTTAILSKKRFEIVLPLSLLIIALVVYILALCNQIQLGFILAVLFAFAFPVLIGVHLITKKKFPLNTSNFFTPGFFIFLVFYLFVFILNYNRGFASWDEFSHWGVMEKEMLRLDQLYSVAESALTVHKDYPPFIPLFETIWCKLCGGYKEAYIYRSLQVLMLSLFFPSLAKLDWKKTPAFMFKLFLIFIAILSATVIIQIDGSSFYRTIYIDCFMGLMFAYCLFIAIHEQRVTRFGLFNLSVALSALLLTKQIGIVFFLLVLIIFITNYFIINKDETISHQPSKFHKNTVIPLVSAALGITVIPSLFLFSWGKYISFIDIPRQFNIFSIHFIQIIGIAKGTAGEAYQHEALVNFVKTMFNSTLIERPISLTYWQLMLVLSLFSFLLVNSVKITFINNRASL